MKTVSGVNSIRQAPAFSLRPCGLFFQGIIDVVHLKLPPRAADHLDPEILRLDHIIPQLSIAVDALDHITFNFGLMNGMQKPCLFKLRFC